MTPIMPVECEYDPCPFPKWLKRSTILGCTGCTKPTYRFLQGDSLEVMPTLGIPINLILTDPPYNIGWKYGPSFVDKIDDYEGWSRRWVDIAIDTLDDNGVIAIINYPEANNDLYTYMMQKGLVFINQLIWNYNTNIGHSKRRYTRSYRTILCFAKGKDYVFNPEKGEYKNPNDKRIQKQIAEGKAPNHYDVVYADLCKNVSRNKKKVGINQLPDKLVTFLINSFTNAGDTVLDPFVGNGTVARVASEIGRIGYGIDLHDYGVHDGQ